MRTYPITQGQTTFLLIFLILCIATFLRFYGLGDLGFHGDEETTALPAKSLALGNGIAMPSGMPYYRALPQTLLNALSASIWGVDEEFSYRASSAVLGVATVLLLFFFVKQIAGVHVALLAAALLGLSEWHIFLSREARMYGPLMFSMLACLYSMYMWLMTNKLRFFIATSLLFMLAILHHVLGVLMVIPLALALLYPQHYRVTPQSIIALTIAFIGFAYVYSQKIVVAAYRENINFINFVEFPSKIKNPAEASSALIYDSSTILVLAILGIILSLWFYLKKPKSQIKTQTVFLKLTLACLFIATIISAILGLFTITLTTLYLYLLLHPVDIKSLIKQLRLPLATSIGLGLLAMLIFLEPLSLSTLRSKLLFPYPYIFYFFQVSIGLFLVFIIYCVFLIFNKKTIDPFIIICVTFFLTAITAFGLISKWEGVRFFVGIYPVFLFISSLAIIELLKRVLKKKTLIPFVALALVGSNLLQGHGLISGINIAFARNGDASNSFLTTYEVFPDHQGAGQFVKRHLTENDIVVAEDMLQQYWYVGRLDYWLRSPQTHILFLYRATDNHLHDIYVSSTALTDSLLQELSNSKQRIFVITSSETAASPNYFLSPAQIEWMKNIKKNYPPCYLGKDGSTNVYCLNMTLDTL